MKDLFSAIRKACRPGLWSQGVQFARDKAVIIESSSDDEIVARVRLSGRGIAPTAVLYPADGEWACDCGGPIDPCAHIAAVAIALRHDASGDDSPPSSIAPRAKLRYCLRREQGFLVLERCIVTADGQREPLRNPLSSALARSGASLHGVTPSHDDFGVDRLLLADRERKLGGGRLVRLLKLLAGCSDIELDGSAVSVSADPILPRAIVVDEGEGVALRIERHPDVSEVIAHRAVLCGTTLRPIGSVDLAGDRLERLPLVRRFSAEELGELVTEVLPDLEDRAEIEVLSRRLPGTARRTPPRVLFEIEQPRGGLSVLPLLVYGDPPMARVDQGRLVHLQGAAPIRDEESEKALVSALRDELNLVPGRRVVFEGREAQAFATRLRAWSARAPEASQRTPFSGQPLVPRFSLDGDQFDLRFELAEGESHSTGAVSVDAASVVRAWEDGFDMVPLLDGGWAPLPRAWLERHGALLSDLLAARNEAGQTPRSAAPLLAELCASLEHPPPPTYESLKPLLSGSSALPEPELPPRIEELVRPYQREGIRWLAFLRESGLGGLLADDMGLGKTLQALATIEGRTLVICPRSVVHNWAEEAARFRPDLSVSLYHGPSRELDPKADITLTTYALLRLDEDRLTSVEWDTLILDESQNIKNPDSQVAQAAYGLKARFRIGLSGTPVENRLDELWSAFHVTNRGLLGGRGNFRDRYALPINQGQTEPAERLARRVRPFILRRLKRDVLKELPPRTEITLHVDLSPEERSLYDALRASTRKEVLEQIGGGASVMAALEALLRLRQASTHTGLLPGREAEGSSKVEQLLEHLEVAAADGHKALVFSQWTGMLDRIEPHLKTAEVGFERLDGSTQDRQGVVARFQAPSGPPVLLISLKAGGTGLNLTAADHVFIMDPWWNPAVEDQAADRAHRLGQDRPVTVYRMVARDTVEERILALQERKRQLAEIAVGLGAPAAELTREELLELLS